MASMAFQLSSPVRHFSPSSQPVTCHCFRKSENVQPSPTPAVTSTFRRSTMMTITTSWTTTASTATAATLTALCLFFQSPHIALSATMKATHVLSEQKLTQDSATDQQQQTSEQELRDITQRNTRLAGRLSQQFSYARRLAESGDIDGALSAYTSLLKEAPNFAPGYSNRANLFVARNRLDDALSDYTRAIELAPADGDSWVILVNRGVTRLAVDESETSARAALADLNAAYERKGADPLVLQNRAAVYEALGKWESAIRDYQGALKGNSVQPFWLRYGLVLFQKGKVPECLAILKRVSNSYDVDDVRAALAVVYFENGNIAASETVWSSMDRPKLFESRKFLASRKWPPRAIEGMDHFRTLKE